MKYLRFDDFPCGAPDHFAQWKTIKADYPHHTISKFFFDILNKYKTPYIWGVSPFLIDDKDIEFLNENAKYGDIVMHGFNHAWDTDWDKIEESWPKGGEFSFYTKDEIRRKYEEGLKILSKCRNFNIEHHIPPFNCYNQDALDVFQEFGVKYLHTCDKEDIDYNFYEFNFHDIKRVTSRWQINYGTLPILLQFFEKKGQMTIHWIYDCDLDKCLEMFEALCNDIVEENKKLIMPESATLD